MLWFLYVHQGYHHNYQPIRKVFVGALAAGCGCGGGAVVVAVGDLPHQLVVLLLWDCIVGRRL